MKTWIYGFALAILPASYIGLMLITQQPIEWVAIAMMALITIPVFVYFVIQGASQKKQVTQSPAPDKLGPATSAGFTAGKALSVIGWTLVVIGAMTAATVIADQANLNVAIGGSIALACMVVGTVLAELGVRLRAETTDQVKRKFNPGTIAFGLAIFAASCFVLYIFSEIVHILPKRIVLGALLGVPIGLVVAAACFDDACALCDESLRPATLRFASVPEGIWTKIRNLHVREALEILGAPVPRGSHRLAFWYCPTCRQTVLCRPRNEKPFVLQGNVARLLTDMA